MSALQKVAVLVVGGAIVTSLILPGRQTPAVIKALTGLTTGTLKTVQGR